MCAVVHSPSSSCVTPACAFVSVVDLDASNAVVSVVLAPSSSSPSRARDERVVGLVVGLDGTAAARIRVPPHETRAPTRRRAGDDVAIAFAFVVAVARDMSDETRIRDDECGATLFVAV